MAKCLVIDNLSVYIFSMCAKRISRSKSGNKSKGKKSSSPKYHFGRLTKKKISAISIYAVSAGGP
ncbi:MAG: hypothetical protein A3K03_08830 [Bdellovibrionales bacterium RIFOXYD1_FULL_44_7]|nr:MAG: hypothetical protein A3K03_08830 [Bdellovibrionales bacterium RIFOXYD1_FULL_44_7]